MALFLSVEHLMSLMNLKEHQRRAAQREHHAVRDCLAKKLGKKRKLTIREYCQYYEIPYEDVISELRAKGHKDV